MFTALKKLFKSGTRSLRLGAESLSRAASTLTLFPKVSRSIEERREKIAITKLETDPNKIMMQAWEQVGDCMWKAIDEVVPKEVQEKIKKDIEEEIKRTRDKN